MRYYEYQPEYGEVRFRRRFLWLSKTINNETRWLEMGQWVERYDDGLWKFNQTAVMPRPRGHICWRVESWDN